ncbi:MAG: hypothetical protein ACTSVR_11765 [Candidatus Thorarchaeota archaeon]
MMNQLAVEAVLYSRNKLNNRSNSIEIQHDRTVAKLSPEVAEIFSAIWFRVTDVWLCYKSEDDKDFTRATETHHENLSELQPKLDNLSHGIVVYESYMASMELVMKKHSKEWRQMKWKQYSNQNVNQPQLDLAEQLKRIYMNQMSLDTQEDIENVADMFDLKVFDMDAQEFFSDVVEPICDALPSLNGAYVKIDADTFEVTSQYGEPTFNQSPDVSSLPNLFAHALAVHSVVAPNAVDTNRSGIYETLVAMGKYVGSLEEFEAEHPSPKERKKKIVHELMHTVDTAIKLRGGVSRTNRKLFEKFLMSKPEKRNQR